MRITGLSMLLLLGCAPSYANAQKPQIPICAPSEAAPVDAGNDLGGDADFRSVASHAFATDTRTARSAIEAFLAHHPNHHERPAAIALLARELLALGDTAAAKALLDRDGSRPATQDQAFLAGLCESRLGNHARAVELLRGFAITGPPTIGGQADPDANFFLRTALAESLATSGDPAGAIDQFDVYQQQPGIRDYERFFAGRRSEDIASQMTEPAALQALSVHRGALTRALLGAKAVAALRARGDELNAAKLEQDTVTVRRQLGLETVLPWAGPGDPLRFGLVVPLSGPQTRLGEVVLRGAMLAITAATHSTEPLPYHLFLRDSAAPPDRSAHGGGPSAGVFSLAREESAIGAVSSPDAHGVEIAARDGLPLLILDEHAPGIRTTAFQLVHSAEARAIALARKALELGARRFAILGPDSASGKRLAAAFKNAVERGGGDLAGYITYPSAATSFTSEVAGLRKLAFDALFIPDEANRLELVAPALVAANIWPHSPRTIIASTHEAASSGSGLRETLLLSTALSLSPKLLHNAERYVQGALLCPGFYPADDNRSGSFVSRFRESYGTSPSAADAYGYDGISLLRGAVERGAKTRADVLRILAREAFEGITGDIRFGADHGRIDPPLVYVVDGDNIRTLK